MRTTKKKGGIEITVETNTTITFTMSQDAADCLANQLDIALGGEVNEDEYADLHDFVELLNEVNS